MKTVRVALIFLLWPLLGRTAEVRKHIFSYAGPLTEASSLRPRAVADGFLQRVAMTNGLSAADLAGVYVAKEYRTRHNGVTHIVYRQQFQGLDVYNAEWCVNIDRDGRVINAGGMLYSRPGLGVNATRPGSAWAAVRGAAAAVNSRLGEQFLPLSTGIAAAGKLVQFHRGGFGSELEGQAVWYAVAGALVPAWVFYIVDEDGINSYAVVVDEMGDRVLAQQNLTWFQAAPAGLVFERESPQPNPKPGVRLTSGPEFVPRTMQPFTGDPTASPVGWLSDRETAGNNALVGANPLGVSFLLRPQTASAPSGDFSFPLQLGPGAPNPSQFADAATTNLFYWVNRAHDLFYEIGFDEAAGNYQLENFGRGGVEGDRLLAYSHYGAAGSAQASLNNAFFSTRSREDGGQSMIAMFLTAPGTREFLADGSYDAGVILHEYTHGVSLRLVRQLSGFQGSAMGEAWSDFFALEFLTPEGAPPDGSYAVGEYWLQNFGTGIRTRPYSTNREVNPLTFADLGHVTFFPEVHADGEIWVQALWEMRANLIEQYGESEGRRRLRLLVMDGMKLSPPAPSMVDMRDAILLADQVDFEGASQQQIWAAFARRGLGVLAQSASNSTLHVAPSFEPASSQAAIRFYENSYVIGETVRLALYDPNLDRTSESVQLTATSGDTEVLTLRRAGSIYLGSMATTGAGAVSRQDGRLQLVPGSSLSASYGNPQSFPPIQLQTTAATRPPYAVATSTPPGFSFGEETRLNFRATPGAVRAPVALPFEFPFFGKKYSSVWVNPNGLLTFDLPNTSSCSDLSTLRTLNAIAPLWMDLRTNGSAQPNEDVYQSRGPDWVTFRWAAETLTPSPAVSSEPVNFAATLYQDGRIEFLYGSGNRNLSVAASTFCGGLNSLATVGIANGRGSFVQVASTHHGRLTLENASKVRFDPPFNASSTPAGILESPAPNERFRGVLIGRGVAYDSEASISRVDVFVNGVAVAQAALRQPRPDFCALQSVPGCPNVGFRFTLNFETLRLANGPHTLRLRVTNTRGASFDFPESPVPFQVEPGQGNLPFGAIEAPVAGSMVSGSVRIQGYAAAPDLRISAVDVLVDGVTHGRATYGDTRNDICDTLSGPPPNCPRVGFTFTLNTTTGTLPVPNGSHSLAIRVLDETGRFTQLPATPLAITVQNAPNQPPAGQLTTPLPNQRLSGTVKISGFAYDPDGRVVSALLLIDGLSYGTIPYGRPRPEECAQLQGVAACPNIGFELDFDTRRLSNGNHVLGIRLQDDRGATTVIPSLVRNGMNVSVEN